MARLTKYDAVRGCYVIVPDTDQNHIQKLGQLEDRDEAKDVIYNNNYDADGDIVYKSAICPICQAEINDEELIWRSAFCPSCGQRLKWGE